MVAKKKTTGGSRVRHDEPIGVIGTVKELPPRQYSSQSSEILKQITEAKGDYIELDPKGRQASSVQSMITSAADRAEMDVTVSVRGERVYARLNK